MSIFNQQKGLLDAMWYPIGSIIMWPSNNIPEGWLLCRGQQISYTAESGKYRALYDVIGTTFGEGTEGGSFKLPDMQGRFIEGASNTTGHKLGDYVSAGIPKINLVTSSSGSHSHTFTGKDITGSVSGKQYALATTTSVTNTGCLSFSNFSAQTSSDYSSNSDYPGKISFSATVKGSLNNEANHSHTITAKSNETIYGKSTTVQPAAVCVNYIIKY